MAENEKTEKDEKEEKVVTPEEKALLDKDMEINNLKVQLAEKEKDNASFSQVVATPEVRTVLDAIDKGETVKVVVGEEEDEKAYDPETVEDLDNKGIIDASARQTSHLLGGILDEKLSPLVRELESLKEDKKLTEKVNLKNELGRAIKRFPDLNTYTNEMIELKKENKGMGVEELYVLARTRAGKGFPDPVSTASERPSSVVPKVQKERKDPVPHGPKGLDQLIKEVHETDEFADVLRGAGTSHEGQAPPE